ncbi:hypothetical protein MLD38_012069 [Melastoma candidum]|uniref:Uncharacterized protein n=1 Tax=Melastoma candidum TaxID=119954 RepID=A0ACB9R6W9_9MYRT|nr:hypothetical protein MLD38_012069 [Melastoma candidum]
MERKSRKPPQKTGSNKDKDDDLLLFRELRRRAKDRPVSLLQPVSDEFEPNGCLGRGIVGNYPLYRIAPTKKGSGSEFLAENDKNDYDWLKTPPATPLFPSLEMETNAEEYVVQREIPIMQPLSRFAGQSMSSDTTGSRTKHPIIKPNAPPHPLRLEKKDNISTAFLLNQKIAQEMGKLRIGNATSTSKLAKQQKPPSSNTLPAVLNSSNLPKSMGVGVTKTKLRSRGVSPMTRPSMLAPPTNDPIDRAVSAVRGRPMTTSLNGVKLTAPPQGTAAESNPKSRRQSCSPRRMRSHQQAETARQGSEAGSSSDRGRSQSRIRSQVLGSMMVDRVMNARRSAN